MAYLSLSTSCPEVPRSPSPSSFHSSLPWLQASSGLVFLPCPLPPGPCPSRIKDIYRNQFLERRRLTKQGPGSLISAGLLPRAPGTSPQAQMWQCLFLSLCLAQYYGAGRGSHREMGGLPCPAQPPTLGPQPGAPRQTRRDAIS